MRVRGGPTSASAPVTPGIVWHEAQPYLLIFSRPRAGTPPVIAAALRSASPPHDASARNAKAAAQTSESLSVSAFINAPRIFLIARLTARPTLLSSDQRSAPSVRLRLRSDSPSGARALRASGLCAPTRASS